MMWGFIKFKVGTEDRLGEVVTWRGRLQYILL
jgi:hypothetical protein